MADEAHPKEFPDVNHKLAAPKKLSTFEKERQAAAAKQQRAEAENAAALRAFQESFADEDDDDDSLPRYAGDRGPPGGPRGSGLGFGGQGGRRDGPRSGPGSLGPLSGQPPPPPSLKRKRALEEMREVQEARREQEMLAYGDELSESRGPQQEALRDEDHEIDAPRPTIQLSSLPPGMSVEEVKTLFGGYLNAHSVHFLPPAGPGPNIKRSVSAIATLSSEVASGQIDTAVSALKDKYLGRGFYLSISRHLSSVAMHPTMSASTVSSGEPFGAERPRDREPQFSMRNAPPPMDHRGFAPPDSYDQRAMPRHDRRAPPPASVAVRPPLDIESVKAVHTVVDQLLQEPDPERALEIEAMLMSLPEVQKDERFAFLYDSKSPAGVYYRFLLWAPEDPSETIRDVKRRARGLERIYEDVAIDWVPPYADVPFPDLKSLSQVVTDIDYISSDEESDDEGAERQFNSIRDAESAIEGKETRHLRPLKRARLTYLLSRLPTSNGRLRRGDVARVTNFAINHAGAGAEEIVAALILNVEKPFSYSLASKYEDSDQEQDEEDVYEPDEDLSNLDSPAPQPQVDIKRDDDPSNSKLIALYVISDILSASSTAGARNAWKFRQLFESGFKAQKTFEHLGKLDRELGWGRMKAEQWKRKIGVVFSIWEGWSVFPTDVHEELKKSFFEPPLSEVEKLAAQAAAEREEKRKHEDKLKGKFKRVGNEGSPAGSASPASGPTAAVFESVNEVAGGATLDGSDGAPSSNTHGGMSLDNNPRGKPKADEHTPANGMLDGGPVVGLDGAGDEPAAAPKVHSSAGVSMSTSISATANGKPTGPRRRMRAEDMFADSDDE